MRWSSLAALGALLVACSTPPSSPPASADGERASAPDEVTSLLGARLVATPAPAAVRAKRERELADARAAYEARPDDPDAILWLGRRTAYLGRYREAIRIFGEGIAKHPRDARFYRHRGHRWITLRRFGDATADLARARDLIAGTPDAVEPDGQPNARNTPISTLHGNVHYHLGLARYLGGDFAGALEAYEACARTGDNPDHRVSSTYWLYLTLRRLGRDAEAKARLDAIPDELELLENHAYHRLLVLYRTSKLPGGGESQLDDATTAYGVGMWHLLEGRTAEAEAHFRKASAGPMWAAFGAIAAEAELARKR